MSTLSFKQYLSIMTEDTQQDVNKLMSDISLIDTQVNQRTQPLLLRKAQLQKLLAIKQKMAQAEEKKNGGMQAPNGQQQGQPSNQTTTPGGTGSATPGGAPALTR
jgi:hypothetical protein